jgi:BirA family biotin operon repressor/biotin-[acetyl-CoA-carboxylase] ligase
VGARIILGIGINLNLRLGDLPPVLRESATTALEVLGHTLDRDQIVLDLLDRLSQRPDPSHVIERWRELSATLGRQVRVENENVITGLAVDIDADGALIVETDEGRMRVVSSIQF